MPYIDKNSRHELDEHERQPQNAGELNYCITQLCTNFLNKNGTNYETLNRIMGALECAKLEFYRRAAVPYENKKITENGDVYP